MKRIKSKNFSPIAAAFCALVAAALVLFSSCQEKSHSPDFVKDMKLVWADEFDGAGDEPNPDYWDYNTGAHGWGNNERQNYTRDRANSYVSDGTLKIVAKKGGDGKWTSARMVSRWKKAYKYGYIEFRAKLPVQKGSWPALWLMPNKDNYGSWPRSGEIDVMEYSQSFWGNKAYGTCHCLAGSGGNAPASAGMTIKRADKTWHNYGVLWTDDKITWIYDGKEFLSYENPHDADYPQKFWPYNREFYVIMNVAMGGTLGGDIPKDAKDCQMEVDYIRWYQ